MRVRRDGEYLPAGSPQQRALLCMLLLREGRNVTVSELIDAMWGDEPPSQAVAGTRTYVSRLRKILGATTLVSEAGGYAIRVPWDTVDLFVAQDLALRAERARTAGDRDLSRALISEALGLWDGEPLANVPGPFAERQRTRLDEWRLQLLETRLDLDLEAGDHADAVSELTVLTAAHPLRERLRELLMLALYRSGRQAEALAVYADIRHVLVGQLGVDPGPELARLQQRILRADDGLKRPESAPPPVRADIRPAQLPADVPDFTGRSDQVRELADRLADPSLRVPAVSVVTGMAGVGKSALAVHAAHALRSRFPDGQLYIDLRGWDRRPVEPAAALGAFLRSLGVPDERVPDGEADRAALFRSALDERRLLFVLDDARDAAHVRPLLPGTAGCATLITSRARLTDLAGAHLVGLDGLPPGEALQLFTRIVGEERVRAEPEAALDTVTACGFLPLAIRLVASRLAAHRTWTVSGLAARLRAGGRRLDQFQTGGLGVRTALDIAYERLGPEQARAFRLFGLAEGPDISLEAAAALLDLGPFEAEDVLEPLVDTSLLESAAPGRYHCHDLTRLYARARAERDDTPDERAAALSRLLDFYLATAARAFAGDSLGPLPEPAGHRGLLFPDRRTALDWLESEARPLLACARQAAAGPGPGRAVDLLLAARDLAGSGAHAGQYAEVAGIVRAATREWSDPGVLTLPGA
ncbi:hypothetical protein SYYSPA8_02930 [Streptomyces yaizuensis]|uniref:OmpR/PhoB-type domain-containing protein n=1 Tax=Streptomyces yaizuensis TaxID=2989713 RepID=A0ABQ5NS71_9ACTN|nr:hypothetical protein SYYSPA8_02930 [Streptomyces sp. YSPA8]